MDSSTVKLAAAPATGASYHAVVMGSTVNIGTPSDNTVTTAILQNNSVSTQKIQDEAITLAKLEHGTSSNNGKFLRANNGADPTFETVNTDLVSDTSPQLGGTLDTNGQDVDFKGSDGNTKILFDASQDQLELADSAALTFGDHTGTGDYNISYVNGADFTILGMNGGSGDLVLGTFANGTTTKTLVSKRSNQALELYFANSKKLETVTGGVTVTGTLTATAYAGDGSGLTGVSSQVADC